MSQPMASGKQQPDSTGSEGVLQLLNQLGDELGADPPAEASGPQEDWPPTSMRREEDEALLVGFRQGLARLAASQDRDPCEGDPAVRAALDGAQLVARNKLLTGEREELRRLLPAFAFLVMLPVAGEAMADRVAGRAALMLEEAPPVG